MRGGIVVPLNVQNRTYGTIKFYFRSPADIDCTQLAIARGFGQLLSTQLSTHELDRQAELTAKAEVKALQAQINPHFLFNTINTIAAFTRTDPTQARALLREFAVFYRQTLESSDQLIPLSRELEQTRRYLRFEHARFGEDRIKESEHIAPDDGPLHIDVRADTDGDDMLIAVADDGFGMDEATRKSLLAGINCRHDGTCSKDEKGTGIALRNVSERLDRFYGYGSGLDIMSKPGEGTCVTMRLARTAVHE